MASIIDNLPSLIASYGYWFVAFIVACLSG